MKQIPLVIIIFTIGLVHSVTAADVVDNPAQPITNPNAKKIDRTVKMTEVFRISDVDENFFLKRPGKIRVAPDGSIFVMDRSQSQLMKFNAQGKFVTRILRKGEGPGELINLYSYWLGDKEIIAAGLMPVKIISMDHQGKSIKEFRVNSTEFLFTFMGRFAGKYYFYIDPLERGDGIKIPQIPLSFIDENGIITKTGSTFPVKRVRYRAWIKRRGTEENSMMKVKINTVHITRFNYTVTGSRYLYITTGERYLIYQYDFEKDKVVKKFRRQYTPISYIPNPNDKFVNSSEFKALYKWEHYTDEKRGQAESALPFARAAPLLIMLLTFIRFFYIIYSMKRR